MERIDRPAAQRMVAVGSCGTRVEAHLKVAALVDAGIRSRVASDDAGGNDPAMAFLYTGAYRVMVPEHQREDAARLLVELDRGDHALTGTEDPTPVGAGRRRRWGWAIVLLIVVFALFRLLDSAFSLGWL